MYCKLLLVFALANSGLTFFISENDVTCSSDGSVSVKKSALGNSTSTSYAFGTFGHCTRVIREDVVTFQRQRYADAPLRMIVDGLASNGVHIIDIHCTIHGQQTSNDVPARKRRAEDDKKPPLRDAQGRIAVGPEVNNTGLDKHGNLVKPKDFKVSTGMAVNMPYADNDEIEIECSESGHLGLSNPDPKIYPFFMGYDTKGNLCTLTERSDKSWIGVTNCDTKGTVKVAFDDKKFSEGVIGGSSEMKIFQINCAKILQEQLPELEADRKGTEQEYYYAYEYENSGPAQTGIGKQLFLLILTLAAVFFLELLIN